ncbi:MAG TPA: hypothetical protein PKD52_10895 [Clostridiales bacterium]|nr:hypothetical protein [Clostridiales bacterium]
MVKKRWCMLIIGMCAFFLLVGGGIYLVEVRTSHISVASCEPQEGLLLAYIDEKPYYYDPVYLYKLTDGAFPAKPAVVDKKKALFYELAYLESKDKGTTVSQTRLKKEIELRKYSVANWDDVLKEAEASFKENKNNKAYSAEDIAEQERDLAEDEEYVPRYYELWSLCTEDAGITEEEYWQVNKAYFKKGILVAAYGSAQLNAYLQKIENQDAVEHTEPTDPFSDAFLLQNFTKLVEKYQVELVDPD